MPKYSVAFEEFWRRYPSGFGSKKVSFQRWVELGVDRDASLLAEIMAGLELWLVSERWRRGFIKAAELWLRDRLWENPPPAESKSLTVTERNMQNSVKAKELLRRMEQESVYGGVYETAGEVVR